MCPQDAGTRLGRRRDATSEPVRQADERSEGTAQRREDPPAWGTASVLIPPLSLQILPSNFQQRTFAEKCKGLNFFLPKFNLEDYTPPYSLHKSLQIHILLQFFTIIFSFSP
ncbi:hypothetical protein JOE09_000702 [Pantoea coffeiphila]|nr:hypothetical protein [Pantoea coffeiphila]